MPPGKRLMLAYVVALVTVVAVDAVWLGWAARDLYARELPPILLDAPRLAPAILFYLFYPLGLVFLALRPLPASLTDAALRSAAVGLLAYGTYDLTNLATLSAWSELLSVVDIAWGTALSAFAGALAYWAVRDRPT